MLVVCFLNFSGDCNCSHSKFIKMCTLSVYFFISVILQRKKQTRNLEERFKRFFFFFKIKSWGGVGEGRTENLGLVDANENT